MRRAMTAIGVAVVMAGAALSVQAQGMREGSGPTPFGIQMGAPKQTLKIESELADGMVKLASVPKPHPDMERYIVQVTPQAGVCWVKGMGKSLSTSAYGDGVRATFTDLKTQLEGVYGPATVIDRLASGSIWHEPNEFTMGMLKKERFLVAAWGSKTGAPIAPGVQMIGLTMNVLSRDSFYASVEYYGTNTERCEAEVNGLKANAFK